MTRQLRRNVDDIKTAITWGPDGEAAFEMETAVRETLIEVADPLFPVHAIQPSRDDERAARAVASMKAHPDTVRSSYSPVGQQMYAAIGDSTSRWPLVPSWSSVYVAPFAWDMNPPDYDLLFSLTTKQLNENWARPGSEWFWDTVDPEVYPPLFEFSMGPKPWMWEQRYGQPRAASTHRSGTSGSYRADVGDLVGMPDEVIGTIEDAVATRQNLMLLTPHEGFTNAQMVARRIPTLLPTWSRAQLPFRAPHHTIGDRAMASEVYLANFGVLFLDEIAKFSKGALRVASATIAATPEKKRPLIVASMTEAMWTNRRNKDHAKIIGFPLVASVPPRVLGDTRRMTPSSAQIRDRIMGRSRTNPPPTAPVTVQNAASELYEAFHRYPPRKVGEFSSSFAIPTHVFKKGRSVDVLYRSSKVDPETLKKPRRPVDYIHEHEPGVSTYMPNGPGERVDVPGWLRDTDALVLIGTCLGFKFEDSEGKIVEVEGRSPMPELYSTVNGKALIVVDGKRTLLALMWGGKLNVEPRGIVG